MVRKIVSGIMSILLVLSMFTLLLHLQPVRASGTIYILPDGSIDPPDAPISTVDKITYNFIGDIINDSIVVERDNIVVDGVGHTLQGTNASGSIGIDVTGRSKVTIKNTNINYCGYGIYLDGSNYTSISGNNITNNSNGVSLDSSYNNSLLGNIIDTNTWWGVGLYDSSGNKVTGNTIANNGLKSWFSGGVYLSRSANNTVTWNNITDNNSYGIADEAYGFSGSIISENIVTDNLNGTRFYYSSGDRIYHNTFANPPPQVNIISSSAVWDDGYPSGGNYWSDYNGTDLYRGAYQNENGSDGIGDKKYSIDSNNFDYYPLMKPYGGQDDIGIVNVTASWNYTWNYIVFVHTRVFVNVTIINYGVPEIFNLTINANSHLVYWQTIFMNVRDSISINCLWDTEYFEGGNYTMSASAVYDNLKGVRNEWATGDNTYICPPLNVAPDLGGCNAGNRLA